jgi:hypothetical protein
MGVLESLSFVAAKKQARHSPQQHRRNKLAAKIDEQINLAQAKMEGTTYAPKRIKSLINRDSGERTLVETTKRVKEWWFVGENGKLLLAIRYGAKLIEFGKNKNAVEVADLAAVAEALTVIKQAVLAGELDAQIEAASGALRAGFKKEGA